MAIRRELSHFQTGWGQPNSETWPVGQHSVSKCTSLFSFIFSFSPYAFVILPVGGSKAISGLTGDRPIQKPDQLVSYRITSAPLLFPFCFFPPAHEAWIALPLFMFSIFFSPWIHFGGWDAQPVFYQLFFVSHRVYHMLDSQGFCSDLAKKQYNRCVVM